MAGRARARLIDQDQRMEVDLRLETRGKRLRPNHAKRAELRRPIARLMLAGHAIYRKAPGSRHIDRRRAIALVRHGRLDRGDRFREQTDGEEERESAPSHENVSLIKRGSVLR